MANTVDLDSLQEYQDSPEELDMKIKQLAEWIQAAEHFVCFTGAGISTSASISDFRGPDGVWTRKAKGLPRKAGISVADALPTKCHMALRALQDKSLMKYIISQNCDGLHRRSGILGKNISELHGNTYLEVCWSCGWEELKPKVVRIKNNAKNGSCLDCKKKVKFFCHCTGNICKVCKKPLKDSIIHFGENLPEKALELANGHGSLSDLILVLGSSLRVSPANDIPKDTVDNNGKLVIVNLQKTPLDSDSHLRIFEKTDKVMELLMAKLNIEIPQFSPHVAIYIGNTHTAIKEKQNPQSESSGATPLDNSHKWTLFLRGELERDLGSLIKSVTFNFDPSFNPKKKSVFTTPPYEISCSSRDEIIKVQINVVMTDGKKSVYDYELNFSHDEHVTEEILFL